MLIRPTNDNNQASPHSVPVEVYMLHLTGTWKGRGMAGAVMGAAKQESHDDIAAPEHDASAPSSGDLMGPLS